MDRTNILCAYLMAVIPLYAQVPAALIQEFRSQKGELVKSTILKSDTSQTTITQDFVLINSNADTVHGRIRLPRTDRGRFPVAFLVVGIETGKDVVQMIEGHDSVIVVGIDYPFKGPYDFGGWNAVKTLVALRKTGFITVPNILLCLDWLFTHARVDTTDVTLIAVSFGVFSAVPAAVADERVRRLAVVQAGGDLSKIIAASSQRLDVPLPSWLAGWLGSWVLAPFEPNRYIGGLAPRPVLLVSGETDAFFPPASVKSLFEHASEPKEWIQHKSGHVMPGEREHIMELTNIVAERLYGSR